jgi:hypothetical protein
VVVLILLLLFRVGLYALVPWAVNRSARFFQLSCRYDRIYIDMSGGNVGISNIVLAPAEGGPPFATVEYCNLIIHPLRLLRGQLDVQRAVADGVDLNIQRQADGTIPLLARFASHTPAAPKPQKPLDLSAPLRIEALRLMHVVAHVQDLAVSPALDATLAVDVRLSDLAAPDRPAQFLIDATSPSLLDQMIVDGAGSSDRNSMVADVRLIVRGLHPTPAGAYLLAMGIRPIAQSINVSGTGHLKASVVPGSTDAVGGFVAMENVICTADGQPALSVHGVRLDADTISPSAIRLAKVAVDGVRASAARSWEGALRAGGFELASAAAGEPAAGAAPADDPPPPVQRTSSSAPVISVSELRISDVRAALQDQSVFPPANLEVRIPAVSLKNLSTDVATTQPDSIIDAKVEVPGIAKSVELTGTARSVGDHRSLKLKVDAEGIRPDALRPYLDAMGVRCDLNDAKLTAQVDGKVTSPPGGGSQSNLELHDVKLTDKTDLFSFDQVTVAALTVDAAVSRVSVDDVDVTGPALTIRRDAEGSFGALGFRYNPAWRPQKQAQTAHAATKAQTKPAATTQGAPPAIDLHHLKWHGVNVELRDETLKPATSIKLADAGVELSDIHVEPLPTTQPVAPGKFRAWLKSPQLIENVDISGTILPAADRLVTDVDVSGSGIHLTAAAPYLRDFGVEPMLQDGKLQLHARADVKSDAQGLTASAAVRDLSLSDQGKEAIGVTGAQVDGLQLKPEAIAVDSIAIEKPRIIVDRDRSGLLSCAGFKMLPRQPGPAVPQAPTTEPAATQPAEPAPQTALALKHLTVHEANLQWVDHEVEPEAKINANANVDLDDFSFTSKEHPPATVLINVKSEGVLDAAKVSGAVSASPDSASAALDISATGIRPTALASYFPPGVKSELQDGRFAMHLDASASDEKGVGRGSVAITGLNYRDGENGTPFVKFDSVRFAASRVELPKAIAIDEISLTGLEVEVQKAADGRTLAMGLSTGNPVPATQPTPIATNEPAAAVAPPSPAPATAPAISASQLAKAKLRPEPLVTVDKLDLNIRRISYTDHSRAGSAPLTLDDLRLRNLKRIELLGEDPISRPPVELEFKGAAHPLAESLKANFSASPFASKPTLSLDLAVTGIKGDGVTSLLPELKPKLDGSQLAEGELHAKLEGQADIFRPTPLQWDLSHPYDLSFVTRNIEFRQAPNGPVLAGLEEVRADSIHVEPAKQAIVVRSLEVTNPTLVASREKDGLHALGFVLKPPATQPATAPAVATAQPQPQQATPQPPPAKPAAQTSELSIGKFLVSGLNVQYADHVVEPNLLVPLNGLDLEVRGLSSRATSQDIPIRFSAVLNADKVELPRRQQIGALTGAASDIRTMSEGKHVATSQPKEKRDLFSQIEADGVISLYPAPRGWVKASVSGLELVALRGMAKDYGINLEDGTFDVTEDARLPGDGSMLTRTRPVFTDLSVTEPPDGPIFRYLHLPAPLDVVLAAVRDQDGSIAVPLDVPVKNGNINKSDVTAAAIEALGAVLGRAIAAAPAKAAGTVTGAVTDVVGAFVGPLGGKQQNQGPVVVRFEAGDASLDAAQLSDLKSAIERMKKDDSLELTLRHELGGGDVTRAAERANPSPEEAQMLAEQLRAKRASLVSLSTEAEGRTRAQLAINSASNAAGSVEHLRSLRREIAATDDALDQLYELLRPGADRQAGRRTRQACLAIGQARLQAVQDSVLAAGIKDADKRIRVVRSQFNVVQPEGGQVVLSLVKKKS